MNHTDLHTAGGEAPSDTPPPQEPVTSALSVALESTVPSVTADGAVVDAQFSAPEKTASSAFSVSLDNFEGPFDLLLSLIAKRQLDVTEVALSQVTDEFIAYLSASAEWDLGQATQFLVVAATLLDLKTARLLPSAEVEDEEDLALLEARDLLFARLLQYRAYKLAAAYFAELDRAQSVRFGRAVELDREFADLLPEVEIGVSPQRLALIAARALAPKAVPVVAVAHIHTGRVSVAEHMQIIRERVRNVGATTFRALTADCASTLEVVARFLGLLELYREGSVAFDQVAALTELRVRWVAGTAPETGVDAEATGQHEVAESGMDSQVDEEYG